MVISIRLGSETEQSLNDLASQTGRTEAYYLREIIEQGIADMKDYYLAAVVLKRVRKGRCNPPLTCEQTLARTIDDAETARQQLRKPDRRAARRMVDVMDERIAGLENPRATSEALSAGSFLALPGRRLPG